LIYDHVSSKQAEFSKDCFHIQVQIDSPFNPISMSSWISAEYCSRINFKRKESWTFLKLIARERKIFKQTEKLHVYVKVPSTRSTQDIQLTVSQNQQINRMNININKLHENKDDIFRKYEIRITSPASTMDPCNHIHTTKEDYWPFLPYENTRTRYEKLEKTISNRLIQKPIGVLFVRCAPWILAFAPTGNDTPTLVRDPKTSEQGIKK